MNTNTIGYCCEASEQTNTTVYSNLVLIYKRNHGKRNKAKLIKNYCSDEDLCGQRYKRNFLLKQLLEDRGCFPEQ